jgi:hypothetical protein
MNHQAQKAQHTINQLRIELLVQMQKQKEHLSHDCNKNEDIILKIQVTECHTFK